MHLDPAVGFFDAIDLKCGCCMATSGVGISAPGASQHSGVYKERASSRLQSEHSSSARERSNRSSTLLDYYYY